MSDTKQLEPWQQIMIPTKERFVEIAAQDKIVDWARESMFALQAIERNDYLREIANGNPHSLRDAIINVAACGITLNPAAQYAALVPRKVGGGKMAVCLDIMYRGLIRIATDAGSIRWVQAELVYETDEFTYSGKVAAPVHKVTKVFGKDRGAVVGVYCIARTAEGDVLTDIMSVDEINEIRDRSESWKAYSAKKIKSTPWSEHWGEMAKKTIIKRARKTWPETDARSAERLHNATELANLADGYDREALEHKADDGISPYSEALSSLPAADQLGLREIAGKITAEINAPDTTPQRLARMWNDEKLDTDHQLALFSLLSRQDRGILKKALKAPPAEARA